MPLRRYFGTDGVRGLANGDVLTPEFALQLGRAAAAHFAAGGEKPLLVVGRDTRRSCDMLESALVSGILSAGGDVVRVGVLPTPGVARLTVELGAVAGAMISASHNPFQDNGIKFFDRAGYKLDDAAEEKLESFLDDPKRMARATAADVGREREPVDAERRYLDFLRETVPPATDFASLRLVLDCANGAASSVGPALFRALGASVDVLNDKPDGTNVMAGCGCLHPDVCREAAKATGAIGLSYDGDADRVLLVDETGAMVDGDQVLLMCARDLAARGRLAAHTVVGTVMSNFGLEAALSAEGIRLARAAVGDRYVLEEMQRTGASLGGEPSGHVLFRDHATTGDGLLTSLQVLRICVERGEPLSKLAGGLARFPQVLLNVRVKEKPEFRSIPELSGALDTAERRLAGSGRVLVRYSGTEPLARVMVEGKEENAVRETAEALAHAIRDKIGTKD